MGNKIMRPRDANKIRDIKNVRQLTYLLGKFNIPGCYREFDWPNERKRFNGWGLKEAKNYVESKFEYQEPF